MASPKFTKRVPFTPAVSPTNSPPNPSCAPEWTAQPDDSNHKPFTHANATVSVVFDPHVSTSRRRRDSYPGNNEGSTKAGNVFLHRVLGHWESLTEATEAGEDGDETYLKTMTRNQLHDMVLGLREMGRKYANVHLHMAIKNIFILTKLGDSTLITHTRILSKWLLENGYNVFMYTDPDSPPSPGLLDDLELRDLPTTGTLNYWTPSMCTKAPGGFDFVITLGGDGTVLYASWLFQKVVPPVLSFSLGSLGFLTKFDFADHASTLTRLFSSSGLTAGLRTRFEGTIMRSIPGATSMPRNLRTELLTPTTTPTHRPFATKVILNEVVVDREPNATMSTTELYANDEFLTSVAADGICVATPTGSTAYSLAAGGSLCHPALLGMLVSAICAHSLTFRPVVLPDSVVLRVGVPYDARTSAWVSFDGRFRQRLEPGDYVTVVTSQYPFPTVQNRMDNKDWFDSIKRNMNWGDRVSQKASL